MSFIEELKSLGIFSPTNGIKRKSQTNFDKKQVKEYLLKLTELTSYLPPETTQRMRLKYVDLQQHEILCPVENCTEYIKWKQGKGVFCLTCNKKDQLHKKFISNAKYLSAKATLKKRYGVEYYSQTSEFKDKIKKTNQERYGVDNYSQTEEFKEKSKEKNRLNYGVDWYVQSEEFKEKSKDFNLKKHGVEHYSQTQGFKDKIKKTSKERYGVEHYRQTEEAKERYKKSMQEKYQVDNYSQTDAFKKKYINTMQEKYRVDNYSQSEHFKENYQKYQDKAKITNQEKYQADNYSQSEHYQKNYQKYQTQAKITNQERYQMDWYSQTDAFKENYHKYQVQSKNTNQERYGKEYYSQTEEAKERIKNTNQERYGKEYYSQTEEAKERVKVTRQSEEFQKNYQKHQDKTKATNQTRYQKDSYSQTDEFKDNYQKHYTGTGTVNYQLQEIATCLVVSPLNLLMTYIYRNRLKLKKFMDDFDCSETTAYKVFRDFNISYKKGNSSNAETEIIDFIKASYPNLEIIQGSRNVINPKEIDIFIPSLGLAIEYNGIMFHTRGVSEYSMYHKPDFPMDYHLKKTELCEAKGIQLIHIREDQFMQDKESVMDNITFSINYKLGLITDVILEQDTYIIPRDNFMLNNNVFIDSGFQLHEIEAPRKLVFESVGAERIYHDSGWMVFKRVKSL